VRDLFVRMGFGEALAHYIEGARFAIRPFDLVDFLTAGRKDRIAERDVRQHLREFLLDLRFVERQADAEVGQRLRSVTAAGASTAT
jgi:hypothetical protein